MHRSEAMFSRTTLHPHRVTRFRNGSTRQRQRSREEDAQDVLIPNPCRPMHTPPPSNTRAPSHIHLHHRHTKYSSQLLWEAHGIRAQCPQASINIKNLVFHSLSLFFYKSSSYLSTSSLALQCLPGGSHFNVLTRHNVKAFLYGIHIVKK